MSKKGEIIGFAGLMGSGRTELARSIFGNPDHYRLEGEMSLNKKNVRFFPSRRRDKGGYRLCVGGP